jgi:hypothetical protein
MGHLPQSVVWTGINASATRRGFGHHNKTWQTFRKPRSSSVKQWKVGLRTSKDKDQCQLLIFEKSTCNNIFAFYTSYR